MAYQFTGPQSLGIAGINTGGTTPGFTGTYTTLPDGMVLGQVVEGKDPVNGYWGRFILLFGVASNIVGALCFYNAASGLTILATGANTAYPLCVSMAANTSITTYSWYQIQGVATVKKTAVAVSPNVALYISGTAGRVKVIQSAGLQLIGGRSANIASVTSTTSTVLVTLGPAVAQGQVT